MIYRRTNFILTNPEDSPTLFNVWHWQNLQVSVIPSSKVSKDITFFFLPPCQYECKSSSKHWSRIELKKESLLVIDITVRLFLLMNCISMSKDVCKNSDNKESKCITNAFKMNLLDWVFANKKILIFYSNFYWRGSENSDIGK